MNVRMEHLDHQTDAAADYSHAAPLTELLPLLPTRRPPGLAAETVTVTLGTIAALALLNGHDVAGGRWLVIPALLVAAALVPAWVRRREFPCFGLDLDHVRSAVPVVGRVSIATGPPVLLGLWLLTRMHLPIPLRPPANEPPSWLAWLLYQFLYIAVAEEVFFRGYVQANTARLLRRAASLSGPWQQRVTILVSAACFALAHVAIQGQIISLLVFLPGLVLAWLFVRTRSLFAPILFHGLANVSYGLMATVLT
jgi:membrane protease YdiL (CAAX protease family)